MATSHLDDPEEVPGSTSPSSSNSPLQPRLTSSVEAVVDALTDEESLQRIRGDQQQTLSNLQECGDRIAAITKSVADEYSKNAADFVRAARLADSVRRNLEVASRRISVIRRKLDEARVLEDAKQREPQNAESADANAPVETETQDNLAKPASRTGENSRSSPTMTGVVTPAAGGEARTPTPERSDEQNK